MKSSLQRTYLNEQRSVVVIILGCNVGASMYFEKGNYFTWEDAMKQFNKNNELKPSLTRS